MAADSSIIIKTEVDNKKAQADLQKLEKKIEKIKQEMSSNEGEKSAIEKQLNDAKKAANATMREINRLKEKLKETTAETGGGDPFSEMYRGQIEVANKKLAEQDKSLEKIANSYAKITDKVEAQKGELAEAEVEAGKLTAKLAGAGKSTKGMSEAAEEAQKRFGKMSNHIAALAKRIFVFSLITAALRKIKDYMWEAIQTNDEAMAAVARLKGALMTLAQPIINVVIPAFTLMVNVITRIVNAISRLVSLLFGTTIQKSAQGAKALNDQKKGIEGVGEAAKEASKYLADFDELNVMDDQSSTDGGGGGASGGIEPDFSSVVGIVSDGLTTVATLFTGIALLAIGAILTFSGANIPLGIGMMVLGAMAIYAAYAGDDGAGAKLLVETGLAAIMVSLGPMIAILGVVLIMTGFIPVGIGLLIAGIALFAAGEVALNWDLLKTNVVAALGKMLVDISQYVALFGLLLLFVPGMQAWGVGLIAAGIALFAAGQVMIDWKLLGTNLVAGLVDVFKKISPYVAMLGVLLLFVPGLQAIGIGLIVAGLGMFVFSAIAPNWDYIGNKLKEIWENIKNWWKSNVAKFFTKSWWSNLGRGVINGLLSGLTAAWHTVVSWVTSAVNWIVEQFNAAKSALSGDWARRNNLGSGGIGGYRVNMQAMPALRPVDVPALARGAVIPPNREFMAVLGDQKSGTNIEAPADLIRQIVREELGSGGEEITIKFTGDLAALARVLTPEITRQQRQNQRAWGGGSR